VACRVFSLIFLFFKEEVVVVVVIAVDDFDLYSCVSNDDGRLVSGHSVTDFT
jgi:hypothetical protein